MLSLEGGKGRNTKGFHGDLRKKKDFREREVIHGLGQKGGSTRI